MRFVLNDLTRTLTGSARIFELRIPRFETARQEVVAIVGESGSGKTAMLELLALAAAPDPGGQFVIEAEKTVDIADLWRSRDLQRLAAARAKRLGFVAQTGGLLPFLNVRANAALAQEAAERPDPDRIEQLARRLGLEAVLDDKPALLSIGQRQRAAILRALAHRPSFVIADEPTSALDPSTAREVIELFLSTAFAEGAGVVLSSHNLALMREARVGVVEVRAETPGEDAPQSGRWVSVVEHGL